MKAKVSPAAVVVTMQNGDRFEQLNSFDYVGDGPVAVHRGNVVAEIVMRSEGEVIFMLPESQRPPHGAIPMRPRKR
ncbi:MAG: hypothetical protein JNJ54_35115 [Myxococcaceae bacterium]|nr:hypothetical protein [Myxococcaceae bacterium]